MKLRANIVIILLLAVSLTVGCSKRNDVAQIGETLETTTEKPTKAQAPDIETPTIEMVEYEPYYSEPGDWYDDNGRLREPVEDNLWYHTPVIADMSRLCAVPEEVLNKASTRELVELVVNSRLNCLGETGEYDAGMELMRMRYNAMRELLAREDCAEAVLKYYEDYDIPLHRAFDYSLISEDWEWQEFIDKSLDIFDNEEYSAQINRDIFVKYNLNCCEWLMTQESYIKQLSDEQCIRTVEAVRKKSEELQKSDYSKSISNYFEKAMKNKPGRMSKYLAAIERTEG